jgi:Ca2+-binding RTX toxin-like protein
MWSQASRLVRSLFRKRRGKGRPCSRRLVRPNCERLEERSLLSVDFSQAHAQLPGLLDNLQSLVTQTVLADRMPLVGTGLQSDPNAQFLTPIATALGKALPTSPSATAKQVQDALFNTLKGMNLFPGQNTEDQDVQVVPSADGTEFKVHIASQSPTVLSRDFDLGLPNLPLSLSAKGAVSVSFTYQVELDFDVGLQNGATHLSLDTANAPQLTLHVDATLPNFSATGSFGTLGLQVCDAAFPAKEHWTTPVMKPSEFKGTFTVAVTGPNGSRFLDATQATPAYLLNKKNSTVQLTGQANVNLAAELTVQSFPAVAMNLQVDWPFTKGNLDGDVPTVSFNHLQLDVGTFFSQAIAPLMRHVHDTLSPVDQVVEALSKPLPVISDLSGSSISLLSIATAIDPNLTALTPYLTAFQRLYALSDSANVPSNFSVVDPVIVDFGSFDLGGADPRAKGFDPSKVPPHITLTEPPIATQLKNSNAPGASDAYNYIYDPQKGLEGSDLGSLKLDFLDSPQALFGAMLGQDVTLLQYTMPALDTWSGGKSLFNFDQTFWVAGPLGVRIHGDIRAQADLSVGYDTYGLIHLGQPNPIPKQPPISPLDGIYVSQAHVALTGSFGADLAVNVAGFLEPYVGGGVEATVDLKLQPNPNDPAEPVRYSQLAAEESNGFLSIWQTPAGKLDAYLEAGIKVGVDFGWPVGFVGVNYSTHLADVTLLDFTTNQQTQPVLAHRDINDPNTLVLNLGKYEAQRQYKTSDTKEVFEVGHHPGNTSKGDETIDLTAYGVTQTFDHIKKVVATGNSNDETIHFDPGVLDDTEVTSGSGNNTLSGGSGSNTFTITGGGNNTLIGGPGTNTFKVTGNGDNQLVAGGGNDKLEVDGTGTNTFTAGTGQDTVTVTGGHNSILWAVGDGNLTVQASGGENSLQVQGSRNQPDVFTVSPYPVLLSPGVEVTADGATLTANNFVQIVAIEGSGGDTTTVNDLGPRTAVREVGVNVGQALAPDDGKDLTTVVGNPTSHSVTVGTDSAWLHQPQRGQPQDGGVMFVDTGRKYKVDVGVVNGKDELDVDLKGSQNAVAVQSNTGHTVLEADAGSDAFVVGSDSAPNNGQLYFVPPYPASKQLLFGLRGQLDVNAGPGSNSLTVIDSQDTGSSNLTLADSTITGWVGNAGRPVSIDYTASPSRSFGAVTLKTGKGKDRVALKSTPAGTSVALDTGGGPDQVTVGDGKDTLDSIRGPVTIDGGNGLATVTFDDQGAAGGKDYLFTTFMGNDYLVAGDKVPPANPKGFLYRNVGKVVLDAGEHGNTVTVRSIGAAVDVHAGNGVNDVMVGDSVNGNRVTLAHPLSIDGQKGSTILEINDQGTIMPGLTYTLDAGSVQRTGAGLISYAHVQHLFVNSGSGPNDSIAVLGTAAGTPVTLVGAGPSNRLAGPNASNVWDITGPNAGTLTGAGLKAPVAFSGMQYLVGGAAGDDFRLHTGGSVSGGIDGRGGNNSLDYAQFVGNVTVDLAINKATALGQVLNVANVVGSVGNDVLVGGGQPGTLRGGTGRNLIIARGATHLVGGGGDSILIAGLTAWDGNLTALDHIMMEWERNIPVQDRVSHIENGGGLNGPYRLFAGKKGTVASNGLKDVLTDGGGMDWLFLDAALDRHVNPHPTDVITAL